MTRDPRIILDLHDPGRVGRGATGGPGEAAALPRAGPPSDAAAPEGAISVSEVLGRMERTLYREFGELLVVGEISAFRRHRNGHWYFELRDRQSCLAAMMRSGHNTRVSFSPEDGMQVLARGRIALYRQQGKAQLVVTKLTELGRGELLLRLERLKQKLQAEGLFDPARKRPLPRLPRRVGVVTSPEGAAIHDVIKVLRARAPGVSILLSPTRVQGHGASKDIAEALRRLDGLGRCDVLIVGRGGGSFEDLMSFNMEAVVRAIAGCQTPVISSVGHESDTTLADLVADVRAATPSHAAEMAIAKVAEERDGLEKTARRLLTLLRARSHTARHRLHRAEQALGDPRLDVELARHDLRDLEQRLQRALVTRLAAGRRRAAHLDARLKGRAPARALAERRERLRAVAARLSEHMRARRQEASRTLGESAARLHALSPLAVLERGYALVTGPERGVVTSAAAASVGERLTVRFSDGEVNVEVHGRRLTGGPRSPNEPKE